MKKIFFLFILTITLAAQPKSQMELAASGNDSTDVSISGIKSRFPVLFGTASYYADKFNGRKTATGAIYSHSKMTAACNRLPLGTWIRVTNLRNKRTVVVQVNDRLHPKNPRIVDMSKMAAEKLGYIGRGLTQVRVEVLGKMKQKA